MPTVVGEGKFTYEVAEGWGELPEGWKFTQVAGIAVDSQDRVYVFNRSEHPMIIFDRDGKFITSWGEGIFKNAHGVHMEADKYLYLADSGDHTVRKFTLDGKLLMTLGTENQPGADGDPFNQPTDVSVSSSGEIYVSDGYGNFRAHKYSADGELLLSWGKEGEEVGQFALPHGIFVDKNDRVYVADRENHRIQIFTPEAEFITQWPNFREHKPCTLFIDDDDIVYVPELDQGVSILNIDGELLTRWGRDEKTDEPGYFFAAHTACTDSHGDLYVGEVLEGQRIQKFVRI
ncbi:peptidyl-alpha-hydroxyglycine alpha-amidating lyase family protein [Candidatus Poribacteria bacterium]